MRSENRIFTEVAIEWQFNDGGRSSAGFKGSAGDCVTRAIAIATGKPYLEVYNRLSEGVKAQRVTKRTPKNSSARDGVLIKRKWFKDYMKDLGFEWVSTMGIGTGCKVHLRANELPDGVIIVRASKHMCAVVDRVLQDTYDCSRGGSRCVYGYWKKLV